LCQRDSAIFAAFAANVDDAAVGGGADVADVGADHLIGTQPGQQPGQQQRAVTLDTVASAPRRRVVVEDGEQLADGVGAVGLGQLLVDRRPLTGRLIPSG
jgi:hypothetical protein